MIILSPLLSRAPKRVDRERELNVLPKTKMIQVSSRISEFFQTQWSAEFPRNSFFWEYPTSLLVRILKGVAKKSKFASEGVSETSGLIIFVFLLMRDWLVKILEWDMFRSLYFFFYHWEEFLHMFFKVDRWQSYDANNNDVFLWNHPKYIILSVFLIGWCHRKHFLRTLNRIRFWNCYF